jgi:hypothetical protein
MTSLLYTRRIVWICWVEVYVYVCLGDRAGQIGESGALGREGWRAGRGNSEIPR